MVIGERTTPKLSGFGQPPFLLACASVVSGGFPHLLWAPAGSAAGRCCIQVGAACRSPSLGPGLVWAYFFSRGRQRHKRANPISQMQFEPLTVSKPLTHSIGQCKSLGQAPHRWGTKGPSRAMGRWQVAGSSAVSVEERNVVLLGTEGEWGAGGASVQQGSNLPHPPNGRARSHPGPPSSEVIFCQALS